MGLNLAVERTCVVRILHDWSIRLGENRFDKTLKHLVTLRSRHHSLLFEVTLNGSNVLSGILQEVLQKVS